MAPWMCGRQAKFVSDDIPEIQGWVAEALRSDAVQFPQRAGRHGPGRGSCWARHRNSGSDQHSDDCQ